MMTVSGKLLVLYGPALAAIRVGNFGLKGWWIMFTGFDARKALGLVGRSSLTFFLAHAVHFIVVFHFSGEPCEWCLSPQNRNNGADGHNGAVWPTSWQL